MRIAIAIAPGPAPEPHERGSQRRTDSGVVRSEGGVERPIHRRDHLEQGLLEDGDGAADLVEDGDVSLADLRCAPEGLDVLQHSASCLDVLDLRKPRIVHAIESAADASEGVDELGAARFRRVCRQHRADGQTSDVRSQGLFVHPPAQLADRRGE